MPFLSELRITEAPGEHWARLLADLDYQGARETFRAPAGMLTDFASVPRMLRWWISPTGPHRKAAVVHDAAYAGALLVRGERGWSPADITRKDADGLFRRILRELGVNRVRRTLMYLGVRVGGFVPWRRAR